MTAKTDKQKNDRIYELILDAINTDTVKRLVELSAFRDHDWIAVVYDWLHEFDNGALTLEEGGYIKLERIIVALYESNILAKSFEGNLSRMMLHFLKTFQRWGVQTAESLAAEYEAGSLMLIPGDSLRAALLILERHGLIEHIPRHDPDQETYRRNIEARRPGKATGDFWVRR